MLIFYMIIFFILPPPTILPTFRNYATITNNKYLLPITFYCLYRIIPCSLLYIYSNLCKLFNINDKLEYATLGSTFIFMVFFLFLKLLFYYEYMTSFICSFLWISVWRKSANFIYLNI